MMKSIAIKLIILMFMLAYLALLELAKPGKRNWLLDCRLVTFAFVRGSSQFHVCTAMVKFYPRHGRCYDTPQRPVHAGEQIEGILCVISDQRRFLVVL